MNRTHEFTETLHGIPCLRMGDHGGQASVAAQGAQVMSWKDGNGRERLYLSARTLGLQSADDDNAVGPAIRGGIPVCFPQFSGRGPLTKHGFARNRNWSLDPSGTEPVIALFRFSDDEITRAQWPHAFSAQLQASLLPHGLHVRIQIHNPGQAPFSFTLALHTYLRVADIRQTSLHGLQGLEFEDATNGNLPCIQQESHLQIPGEVDRVYLDAPQKLVLHEAGKPSLEISQQGFTDTVVWNPGPDNARALQDFPDEDWLHMLCVEAACAAAPVALHPGQTWVGSQTLAAV